MPVTKNKKQKQSDVSSSLSEDITESIFSEKDPDEMREEFEQLVAERTAKFLIANRRLKKEIHERSEIESELKQYAQIVSYTREFLSIIDKTYTYLSVNQFYLDAFQIKKDQIVGRTMADLHGKERFENTIKRDVDRALAGQYVHLKYWIELPEEKRYVDARYSPLTEENGKVVGVVISARDITEENSYLSALQYSDELKSTILDTALDGIITINEKGEVQEYNPSAEKIFNYSMEEVIGKNISDLIVPPSLRKQHKKGFTNYLQTGKNNVIGKQIQTTAMRANGEEFPIELTLAEINLSTERLFTAFIRDISAREKIENELIESEHRYRNIVQAAPSCVKTIDAEGTLLNMNPAGLAMIEASNFDEVRGACVYDLVVDEYRDDFIEMNKRVFNGETCDLQFQLEGLKGTRRWMYTRAVPVFDPGDNSNVIGHLALTYDISEQLEYQRALQESEERFRSSFEHGPLGMGLGDKDGNILQVNKALCDFSGYSEAELLNKNFREFVHPDDIELSVKNLKHLFTGEIEQYRQIRRYLHKQGHYVWADINVSVVNDSDGKPEYLINHLQDITEQVRSERLQEAQRKILEQIVSGVEQQEILNNLCLMFEVMAPPGARASVLLLNPHDQKLYVGAAPNLKEQVIEAFEGFMTGECKASCGTAAYRGEKVIVEDVSSSDLWKDFKDFALENQILACWSTPFFSEAGEVLGTFAISLPKPNSPNENDIEQLETAGYLASIIVERARGEEALRNSEEKFSKAFRSNPASMTLTRIEDGTFLEVNDVFEELTGYSSKEAIGQSSLGLNIYVQPDQRAELVNKLKNETVVKDFEMDIKTSQGEIKHILFSAEIIKIGEEQLMLGNQVDITRQKQADNLQETQRKILEQIVNGVAQQKLLNNLCLMFEPLVSREAKAIVTLLDEKQQKLGAAPSIPEEIAGVFNGFLMGGINTPCGTAASTKQAVIVEDVNQISTFKDYYAFANENNLQSSWSTPFYSEKGEVLGTFGFAFLRKTSPTKYDLELLTMAGYLASVIIERSRAEQELIESEARFRGAFGNAPMGTALVDKNGVILQANSRSTEVIGFTPEEIIGKSIAEVTHPDDIETSIEKFKALMSGEIESYQLEKRYKHKKGDYVWCRLSLSLVRHEGEQPLYAIAHIEDISERKKSELTLLRYNRALEVVNQCNATLFHTINTEDLLEQVCDIIVSTGGYRFAWVGYAEADEAKTMIPMAKAGYEAGYLDKEVSWERHSEYYCPVTEAIITSKPVVTKNIKTEPANIAFRDAALKRDYRSCIALPLISEGQAFAAIVIYSSEFDVFDDDELTLLTNLADNLAFGLQSIMNRKVREEAEHSLRISEQKFRALFDENPCMFFTIDPAAMILSVNKFGATELGYDALDIVGRSFFSFTDEAQKFVVTRYINQCIDYPDDVHRWEMQTIRKDGSKLWIRVLARMAIDNYNKDTILIVCEDITEARLLSDKLVHEATHDGLTGLINRHEFETRLQRALLSAQSDNTQHVLCYLDLDRFKIINDTCGHIAGDKLLKQLSEVLHGQIRNRDSLARLGGDEFGLLIEHCSLYKAEQIANKIKQVIAEFQFYWDDNVFKIGVSIGMVEINENSISISDILMTADNACYTAKDKGRDRIHIHKEGDTELEIRRREMLWSTRIQKAFQENRFCLAYQTITPLDLNENKGEHGEILIRMEDEKGDIIMPDVFIPVAERYNLITDIDKHVVEMTFSWLKENPVFLQKLYLCSINLSGPSMVDEHFLNFVIEKFSEHNIPANKICFEITETAAIANLSSANHFISKLKEEGCLFALDDFGSGLSSFAYLKALPVDFLKIDGAFVRDIEREQGDLAIVKSIHEIGRALNKETIAEFVENETIMQILKGIGVNYAQGYGIQRPRPLLEINTVKKSDIA